MELLAPWMICLLLNHKTPKDLQVQTTRNKFIHKCYAYKRKHDGYVYFYHS
jgi:hypothetical protein